MSVPFVQLAPRVEVVVYVPSEMLTPEGTVGSVVSMVTFAGEATHADVLPALSSDCVQA